MLRREGGDRHQNEVLILGRQSVLRWQLCEHCLGTPTPSLEITIQFSAACETHRDPNISIHWDLRANIWEDSVYGCKAEDHRGRRARQIGSRDQRERWSKSHSFTAPFFAECGIQQDPE